MFRKLIIGLFCIFCFVSICKADSSIWEGAVGNTAGIMVVDENNGNFCIVFGANTIEGRFRNCIKLYPRFMSIAEINGSYSVFIKGKLGDSTFAGNIYIPESCRHLGFKFNWKETK